MADDLNDAPTYSTADVNRLLMAMPQEKQPNALLAFHRNYVQPLGSAYPKRYEWTKDYPGLADFLGRGVPLALMGVRASPSLTAPPPVKQWNPEFVGPHGAADPWSRNPGIAPARPPNEARQPDPPSFYEMWAKQGEQAKQQPIPQDARAAEYENLKEYYNWQNPAWVMAKRLREFHGEHALDFAREMAGIEPEVAKHLPQIEKFLRGSE